MLDRLGEQELEAAFRRDLDGCRGFAAARYRSRSVRLRFRDSLARLSRRFSEEGAAAHEALIEPDQDST